MLYIYTQKNKYLILEMLSLIIYFLFKYILNKKWRRSCLVTV